MNKIPFDFNYKKYILLNKDFPSNWSESDAIYHYKHYGCFENREYKNLISPSQKKLNIIYCNNNINSNINYNDIKNGKNLIPINSKNIFNNFFIIIDFPNLGGGTEFFINSIISKYKTKQNFIIFRNINGIIQINLNNEYIIKEYSEKKAISFLKKIKNKINKIFINHIIGHSQNFLNFIMNIDKEIITISHDYYIIHDIAQPYYNQINLDYSPKINLNKINKLIIQNEENLNIFSHFLQEKQNVIISPLPDCKNTLELINTNNENLVIGIIGAISTIKGSLILNDIIIHIKKNNLNIKVVIFGISSIYSEHQHPYKNIDELNNLLKNYKPNILFETSIWPETYSYTLTLAMITQLPILSLKKDFKNVIENRLQSYNKKYFYNNIEDFFKIIQNIKQNYFYTISPIIYYNSFWDELFTQ